jgi:DNA-directed RNA polymerase I subunit RPA1
LGYEEKAGSQVKMALKRYNKSGDLGASEVTMSELNPSRYLGSVSEKFYESREAVSNGEATMQATATNCSL